MRKRSGSIWRVLGLCGSMALAGQASAGVIATDPNAYFDGVTTWAGTSPFSVTNPNNPASKLIGTVDWAVYAPGKFQLSFPDADYTPTANEMVYVYQVFNTGTVKMSAAAVVLDPGNDATNIGDFVDSPDVLGEDPTGSQLTADYARWQFLTTAGIPIGGSSRGLLYSSPNVPMTGYGSVIDGGMSENIELPSPSATAIPEPASAALLIIGGAVLAMRRR